MTDYTHEVSEKIIGCISEKRYYSDSERIVFTYGMELLLNFVLKAMIYIGIGCVFQKGLETVLSIFVFGVLRFFSGGKHAKTDTGCFLISGSIILIAVCVPLIFQVTTVQYLIILGIVNFIYGMFSENQKHFGCGNKKNKLGVLIILNLMFFVSSLGGSYWKMLVMIIAIEQGITLTGDQL